MARVVTSVTLPRYAVMCILEALRKRADDLCARESENVRMIAADDRAVYGLLAAFDDGDIESITITPNLAKEDSK